MTDLRDRIARAIVEQFPPRSHPDNDGRAMFPHEIDLEPVDGQYRPAETVEIGPEDTFSIVRRFDPRPPSDEGDDDA